MKRFLLICLLPCILHAADDYEEESFSICFPDVNQKSQQPSETIYTAENAETVYEKGILKAIILVPERSEVQKRPDPEFEGILFHEVCIPGNPYTLECILQGNFGNKIDRDLILSIRDQIITFYKDQGRPVVAIDIPPQDITDGILQLVVSEAHIGKICFTNVRFYNEEQLAEMIRLQPGDPLDTRILYADIDWMNRSPYRHADLVLQPGECENTTDIQISMCNRFPFRIYTGVDNTGNQVTGWNRWFGGFYFSNIFSLDHTFAFQGTTSSDFEKFYSYTLNYVAPLPYRHILMFFGGYSKVHPEIPGFHSTGESIQASGRYQIPFGSKGQGTLQEFIIGLDYKNTNNNLLFLSAGEIPIITKRVEYLQIMLGYNLGKSFNRNTLNMSLQLFGSPGKVFDDSSNANFQAIRPGTKNLYLYGRFMASFIHAFKNSAEFYLSEQIELSTNALLPGEEMGVGGYDTVRGYREREVNADNAWIGTIEIRSPKMEVFSPAWCSRRYKDQLSVHGFFDYAFTSEIHAQVGEDEKQQLMSVGVGGRYVLDTFVSFRIDWGMRLKDTQFEEAGGSKVHFGLLIGY